MCGRDPGKLQRESNVRVRMRNDAGKRLYAVEESGDDEVVIGDSLVGSDRKESAIPRSCQQVIVLCTISWRVIRARGRYERLRRRRKSR